MTECKVGWTRGFAGSWARGPGPSFGNTNANGKHQKYHWPVSKGAFGRRLRSVLGAWSGQGPGGDGNPEKLAPSGNKNRRADVAFFTSNWSCGVVGSSWSGQCRCNGLEGLEGMGGREGQARRFFCSSSTGRERNGRNKEDPGQGAQRNNGRTGCQTETLGWRVGQMINTYMANEPGNMSCPSSCPGPESG